MGWWWAWRILHPIVMGMAEKAPCHGVRCHTTFPSSKKSPRMHGFVRQKAADQQQEGSVLPSSCAGVLCMCHGWVKSEDDDACSNSNGAGGSGMGFPYAYYHHTGVCTMRWVFSRLVAWALSVRFFPYSLRVHAYIQSVKKTSQLGSTSRVGL
jgi:hypothetical protein